VIHAKVRRSATVAVLPFLVTACSEVTSLSPDAAGLHFAKADAGKPTALQGAVWGGLMSSKRDLEQYILQDGTFITEVHVYPSDAYEGYLTLDELDGGSFTSVDVQVGASTYYVDETILILRIPYRIEGYGTLNFYCEHTFTEEENDPVWYGPMPVVVSGYLEAYLDRSFRSAADFRAWLRQEMSEHMLFFHEQLFHAPHVITYDEDCVPTQVLP
jgi:hypothetical protein